jgi:uncharacterized membrane protein (DUF373 family)
MSFLRQVTDVMLSASLSAGKEKAVGVIEGLRTQTRKNFRLTVIIDAAMIAVLAIVFLVRAPSPVNVIGIITVNLVILLRMGWRTVSFVRNVYTPNKALIHSTIPILWQDLKHKRLFSTGLQDAIKAAFIFYYEKVPSMIRESIIPLAESFDVIKPIDGIQEDVVKTFYPLVRAYLIEAFMYNFLLFTACYGVFVFLIRQIFLSAML